MALRETISELMAAIDDHRHRRAEHIEQGATLDAEAAQLVTRGRDIGFKKRDVAKMLETPKEPASELTPAAPVAGQDA